MDITFWSTPATVKALFGNDYKSVAMFSLVHIIELLLVLFSSIILTKIYRHTNTKNKKVMLIVINIIIWIDEIFKYIFTIATDQWIWNYLPLHLCSINIFICTIHTIKPSDKIKDFLYSVCIPAAVLALIISPWFTCPVLNAMHIHSYSIHCLLVIYSLLAISDKDYAPKLKNIPFNLILLIIIATVMYFVNIKFDTNFLYLNKPEEIFLTQILYNIFGYHYIFTFPFILLVIWILLYAPWLIIKRKKKIVI